MKKLLVTGNDTAIVKEFIEHSEMCFESMSTTDCFNDVKRHFELFAPDGYLLFPESTDDDMIVQIRRIHEEIDNNCPIFICASDEICETFNNKYQGMAEILFKRPVSADNLFLRIMKYFEDLEKKQTENLPADEFIVDDMEMAPEFDSGSVGVHKKHILIVDDDRTILKIIKSVLEEKYDVTTMVNGILVEKFLSTRNVDLIILDYEIPVKTGADIMRDLRSSTNFKKVPICFLTGVDKREKIMEILSLKPDAYLLKPLNTKLLLTTVSNLID